MRALKRKNKLQVQPLRVAGEGHSGDSHRQSQSQSRGRSQSQGPAAAQIKGGIWTDSSTITPNSRVIALLGYRALNQ